MARRKTSRFIGVLWDARRKGWRINLLAAGKKYGFTGIADETRAAVLRDRLALYLGGKGASKLNFPRRKLTPLSPDGLRLELRNDRTSSRYLGVAVDARAQLLPWMATLMVKGRNIFLGRYEGEREAAMAYDRAAQYYLGKRARLNFPRRARAPASAATLQAEARKLFKRTTKSRYFGVVKMRNSWQARITHNYKPHHLGTYAIEEDAAKAYDRAALANRGAKAKLNFPETRRAKPTLR